MKAYKRVETWVLMMALEQCGKQVWQWDMATWKNFYKNIAK